MKSPNLLNYKTEKYIEKGVKKEQNMKRFRLAWEPRKVYNFHVMVFLVEVYFNNGNIEEGIEKPSTPRQKAHDN